MRTTPFAALAATLAITTSLATDPLPRLDPQAQTALNIRIAGEVFLTFAEQGGTLPEPVNKLVTLDSVGPALGADLKRSLPTRDGWNRPLRAMATEAGVVLMSFGADGAPDLPYEKLSEEGDRPLDALDPSSPNRDTVWFGGRIEQQPRERESPSKLASADLRSIGTAIESFAVDNNVYPGPTAGLVPIDALAAQLEPIYIKHVPREDPWRRPYYVWSDGKSYLLVSGGSDGLLEGAYVDPAALGAGQETNDPAADIVFADGQFVRWPRERPEGR